jgi:guanine deaminase
VHLSEPGAAAVALHPAELLYTGTLAGAQALDSDDLVGNFDVGKDADVVLVDASAAPALARRLEDGAWPEDPAEADVALLFTLLMELREEAVTSVVVKGHEVESRPLGLIPGVLSIGRPG